MPFKVLVTDYAWPSLEIERQLLGAAGAELIVAETGEEAELVRLAPPADAILTNWKQVTAAVLDAAPHCRIVSRYGVGVDNIAVAHATELGIPVTNVPDYCFEEVSDHAMALLLACARRVVTFADATRRGRWDVKSGRPIFRVRGQTLGLVGFGRNGRALAGKAQGFGLKMIVYDPWVAAEAVAPFGTRTDDLDALLRDSDYVSIHVPLTDATRGLMNARTLRLMKSSAYLINTSRGPIIEEAALLQALSEHWIAGAALDVLVKEPGELSNPLFGLDNALITPHASFYSEEAIAELEQKAADQVVGAARRDAAERGEPGGAGAGRLPAGEINKETS